MKTPTTAFANDLAKEVAPFQVGVHLSHFGAPQANPHAGVCVLHQRLKARPRDAIHVLNWIKPTQEHGVPVRHVGVHQQTTKHLVRPLGWARGVFGHGGLLNARPNLRVG